MPIKRLSLQLANQIAAGEVVERPASVVKELVENAVDAKASSIVIEIKNAGKQLIKVTDNGNGICKDELPLALAPHATSKISTLEDLEAIVTLGFRGEALASIASVSKLTLVSNTKEQEHGYQVEVLGAEQQPAIAPAAHPIGTSVIVRELFFNTPARRRFLKSDKTEFNHIKDLLLRLALVNYHVEFKFISDGKVVFSVPAHTRAELKVRIGKLLGLEFKGDAWSLDNSNPQQVEAYQNFLQLNPHYQALESESESSYVLKDDLLGTKTLRIHGLILKPQSLSKSSPDKILTFLNGRAISDRTVNHALREAYLNAVQKDFDFKPSMRAVIFMECDPYSVDVNVHPRKDEVRFHNANLIYDCIFLNVKAVLDMHMVSYNSIAKGSLNLDYTQAYQGPNPKQELGPSETPSLTEHDSISQEHDYSACQVRPKQGKIAKAQLEHAHETQGPAFSHSSVNLALGMDSSSNRAIASLAAGAGVGGDNFDILAHQDDYIQHTLPELENLIDDDVQEGPSSAAQDNNCSYSNNLKSYNERLSAQVQEYLTSTSLATKESLGGTLVGKVCDFDALPTVAQDLERQAQAKLFVKGIKALQGNSGIKDAKQELEPSAAPVSLDKLLRSQELSRLNAQSTDAKAGVLNAHEGGTVCPVVSEKSQDNGCELAKFFAQEPKQVVALANKHVPIECLSLVTADVLLVSCADRYFVVRGSELYYECLQQEYMHQVRSASVKRFELSLPFAFKCSKELILAFKDNKLEQLARQCGFELSAHSARGCLELSVIPQLMVQSNLANSAAQALTIIAHEGLLSTWNEQGLRQLAFKVSRAKDLPVNSEYEAQRLCKHAIGLEALESLVRRCKAQELNLLDIAAALLR